MSKRKYTTLPELFASYTPPQDILVQELRALFLGYTGATEAVKRDYLHFRFPNDMWFYLSFKKGTDIAILGFSRGAKITTLNPLLDGRFDEVMTVVGKVYIYDKEHIYTKALPDILDRVYTLPKGMGVL